MDEEKERLAKVCIDRMDRELKKGLPPMWYLGYITGILDVLWDYDRKLWERVARLKIEKIKVENERGALHKEKGE